MRRTSTSPCKISVNDVVSDLRTETAAFGCSALVISSNVCIHIGWIQVMGNRGVNFLVGCCNPGLRSIRLVLHISARLGDGRERKQFSFTPWVDRLSLSLSSVDSFSSLLSFSTLRKHFWHTPVSLPTSYVSTPIASLIQLLLFFYVLPLT